MNNRVLTNRVGCTLLSLALCTNSFAATTDLSSVPLVTSSTDAVLPNIMFVLDDSGSMDWDFMPDTAENFQGDFGGASNQCNGVYYNPSITYTPPVTSTGTSYASSSFTAAWTDGYATGNGTTNLSTSFKAHSGDTSQAAYYYTYSGVQDTEKKKDYYNTTSVFYKECNTPINSTLTSAFAVTGVSGSPSVSGITVNGKQIMSASTGTQASNNALASAIAAKINLCTTAISGNCTVGGYSAAVSGGNTVTISAPSAAALGYTPQVTKAGTATVAPPAFAGTISSTITLGGSGTSAWQASYAYAVGDQYWRTASGATIWYVVNTAYTSGTSFGSTDTSNAGSKNSTVTNLTVNGAEILSATTVATDSSSTLATSIRNNINACTAGVAGNCTVAGYSATVSGSTITITAPNSTASTYTPVATFAGPMVVTGNTVFTSSIQGLGMFSKVTVGATSGPGSTDERTNFANWYSYYRTRMLMMKTASGLAFKAVNDKYRVAFMTINNNVSPDILNFATFDPTQKSAWYTKLYSAVPNNSTPLREALARVGRIYAGKITSLYGATITDPIQYSCQQNFTILSTDGFWNGNNGTKLDGSTAPGNQDGTEVRPMNDGSSAASQAVTTTTTVERKQTVQNTTTTTPWTRNVTTVGAACSTTASTPSGTTSAYLRDSDAANDDAKIALGLSATNPDTADTNHCYALGGSGAGKAWICRGSGENNPVVSLSSATDSTGKPWYLVIQGSALGTDCVNNEVAFKDTEFSKRRGACPGTTAVSGNTVTTQNQVYNQLATGDTTTVNDHTTVVTSTVVTTNGQSAPPITSTSGPTVTTVSGPTTAISSDSGAPSGGSAWNNSGSATSACVASPPAAGTSTPVAGSAVTANNGAATVTTVSTSTTVGAPVVTASSSGGTSNTLADMAQYYYITDLRDSSLSNATGVLGADVTANNVPASGDDGASWQHMTTFTLGLGARGRMVFSPTYESDTSGDYFSVKNGSAANSAGGVCSWQADGTTCNWPTPGSGNVENIDDLWHAAVNGRGTYFSAANPSSLATGLSSALAGVSARTGASAAATTSNPNVTSGDNFVFSSTFTTQEWDGELVRQQLDLTTGVTSDTVDWAAQAQLDANGSRNIYTFSSAVADAANKLRSFTWANLTTAEKAFFETPAISTAGTGLTQYLCASASICLSSGNQTAAAGSPLVSFLRGDRTNEGIETDNTKYYRQRIHLLGDIVNAEAVYVKASLNNYADFNYSSFVTSVASRQGMVYAAANDGMLHAFYAADGSTGVVGGKEAWAYIPTMVMPNLYKLADKSYKTKHQYYVDGTPVSGDICTSNCGTASAVWKTILVGGLNRGGQGYYALDITDPATPKALWEFTDDDMGYTYGNPNITKLKDGTWVVLVTSGYNNVTTGDGVGRLYVINATTGTLIRTISTGVGSVGTPSGLSKISAKVVNPSTDNTVQQVYGGDVLGNLWRFDVNGDLGPSGYEAQLLVTLRDASSNGQPMTAKPEIGIVNGHTVVYVGTGRYLGSSDTADTRQQTIYAIRDDICYTDPLSDEACSAAELARVPGTAIYSNPRSDLNFVEQVQTETTCPANSPVTICTTGEIVRTSTSYPVDMGVDFGWYVDLPDVGERANTDPVLALGTLGFTTNVPNSSACTVGGISYRYFLDYRTGAAVSSSTTGVASKKLGNALATRPVYVRLPNNTIVELTRLSDGTTLTSNVPIGASGLPTRRTSWRELTD